MATENWVDAIIGIIVFGLFYGIIDIIAYYKHKDEIDSLPEEKQIIVLNKIWHNIGLQTIVVII